MKRVEDVEVGDGVFYEVDGGDISEGIICELPGCSETYKKCFGIREPESPKRVGLIYPSEITHINGQPVITVIDKSGTTMSVSNKEPGSFSEEGFENLDYQVAGSLPESSAILGDAHGSVGIVMHEHSVASGILSSPEMDELRAHAVNSLLTKAHALLADREDSLPGIDPDKINEVSVVLGALMDSRIIELVR